MTPTMPGEITLHPIQTHQRNVAARVRAEITLRAYEVYCELHGPQAAMVTGGCRGGFGEGELIAYLYARTFPRNEWSARFDEALRGMEGLS
jgi:hypothetical protein